jgi:hypothetical protein
LVDLGRRESSGRRLLGSISNDGNQVVMSTFYVGDGRLAAAHRQGGGGPSICWHWVNCLDRRLRATHYSPISLMASQMIQSLEATTQSKVGDAAVATQSTVHDHRLLAGNQSTPIMLDFMARQQDWSERLGGQHSKKQRGCRFTR